MSLHSHRLAGTGFICLLALLCVAAAFPAGAEGAAGTPVVVISGMNSRMAPIPSSTELTMFTNITGGVTSLQVCSNAQLLDTVVLPGDALDRNLSRYGVACVIRPQKLYLWPDGEPSQFIYESSVSIGLTQVSDSGTLAFASRTTNHHGLREMWIKNPGQPLTQLPAIGENVDVDNMFLSSTGRLFVTAEGYEFMRIYSWTGSQWTNLTAGLGGTWWCHAANRDGSELICEQFNGTENSTYYRYREEGFTPIMNFPYFAETTLAENGSVLLSFTQSWEGDPPSQHRLALADGTSIDLTTVVPAGRQDVTPINMNYLGQVLLSAKVAATGKYEYYTFDGASGRCLLDGLGAPVMSPVLGGDGLMYYYDWADPSHSTQTLYAIPEPATLALLALGAVAILRRR